MANSDVIPIILESKSENAQNFVTKLPHPLILSGEWEVGLQELIVPQTWNNINEENCSFTMHLPVKKKVKKGSPNANSVIETYDVYEKLIPQGYYGTIDDILNAIKAQFEREEHGYFHFEYNQHTRYVTITLNPGVRLDFGKSELGKLLGFDKKVLPSGLHPASYPAILDHIQSLYIYSDCIKPILVGNTIASLLLVVPVTVNRPRSIYLSYNQPRFIPVSKQVFDHISISLYSNSGKPILFNGGNVYVKLLFRKVK